MKKKKSNMYANAKTWNPFRGCYFDCIYCRPSFKKQSKRQRHLCMKCYTYTPHFHEERLGRIPSDPIIFVCGISDICFCPVPFIKKIINAIKLRNEKYPNKIYYFQSKNPIYFKKFMKELPNNCILLMTLETNRDKGYREISHAPVPSKRYKDFKNLKYPRKVVTIEPLMDFDLPVLGKWIKSINPEYVWLGLNSKPKSVQLPEPSADKIRQLIKYLKKNKIQINRKELRGIIC